jgi:alcohol dehydrogenase class IV
MWYFSSPNVVFGEGALDHLATLKGKKALVVTDPILLQLGAVEPVRMALAPTRMEVVIFSQVEAEPSLQTVENGAQAMLAAEPDWIFAVGGGSVMDAAKAMWILYENPTVEAQAINPIETFVLREKAKFVAVPTTSGTGSEATWAIVLTDTVEKRKLGLGNRSVLPDLAILDPEMVRKMPARITADTGMDVLVHAIEGYTNAWRNDFSDGLCLKAAELVLAYLPRAYRDGEDLDARIHMQNAAAIAGLGFGNSMAALAHGLGHALGADFHIPHGRAVGLFLPYTIEYAMCGEADTTRYRPIAMALGLQSDSETNAAAALVRVIRELSAQIGQPQTLAEAGLSRENLDAMIEHMAMNALMDTQTIMGTRVPEIEDIHRLFNAAFNGSTVNF